jgi:hypothetical protein
MHVLALLLVLLIAGAAHAQTPPGAEATPGVGVPSGLPASAIVTGGIAVTVMPAGWMVPHYGVCDIVNPATATELLYVDLVNPAAAGASTSIPLQPGWAYRISKQIGSAVSAVAATTGHPIVGVCY